jgi:hypothetical protein
MILYSGSSRKEMAKIFEEIKNKVLGKEDSEHLK